MSKRYYRGETVQQIAEVTTIGGVYVSADTITISICDPNGDLKVDEAAMHEEVTGKYYYNYLIQVDAEIGKWKTEVKAVKGFAQIEQDEFTVMGGSCK